MSPFRTSSAIALFPEKPQKIEFPRAFSPSRQQRQRPERAPEQPVDDFISQRRVSVLQTAGGVTPEVARCGCSSWAPTFDPTFSPQFCPCR